MNKLFSINNLKLHNFKCYDDTNKQISFGTELTVVIGPNGAGKTALMNAVKKAVSFILARDRRQGVEFVGDVLNIRQNTIKNEDARYHFDYSITGVGSSYPVQLFAAGKIREESTEWYVEKKEPASRSVITFREALDKFLEPLNNGTQYPKLPLLCFFSDCYPHVRGDMAKYEKDILYNKNENPERRAGYYRWDENSSDFYFWEGLFVNAYKKLNDLQTGWLKTEEMLHNEALSDANRLSLQKRMDSLMRARKEVEYVTDFMVKFSNSLPTYDNLDLEIETLDVARYTTNYNDDKDQLRIVFRNGESRSMYMLPEGHKRLFSMVFEMVYRHFILNRVRIIEGYENCYPEGIVVIDEVELHLHPTLAQETIERLRSTFPHVQFIVTTHSPAVVSNVVNDGDKVVVKSLTRDHSFVDVEDCFGADYSDTLSNVMGSYGRHHELEILKQMWKEACQENDEDYKKEITDILYRVVHNSPQEFNVPERILSDWGH